jgi:hypothetical protein
MKRIDIPAEKQRKCAFTRHQGGERERERERESNKITYITHYILFLVAFDFLSVMLFGIRLTH